MQLPAALEQTTLGDVLGVLHRGRSFGVLELEEFATERRHEIHFWDGQVVNVVVARAGVPPLGEVLCRRVNNRFLPAAIHRATLRLGDRRSLGERLIATGVVSRAQLNDALIHLYRERLDWLERLGRARLRFRPLAGSAALRDVQLGPEAFLHGRKRRRAQHASPRRAQQVPAQKHAAESDYAVLGLRYGASLDDVKRAFRLRAREWHPDRSVHLGEQAVRRAEARFRHLCQTYERLCKLQAHARLVS